MRSRNRGVKVTWLAYSALVSLGAMLLCVVLLDLPHGAAPHARLQQLNAIPQPKPKFAPRQSPLIEVPSSASGTVQPPQVLFTPVSELQLAPLAMPEAGVDVVFTSESGSFRLVAELANDTATPPLSRFVFTLVPSRWVHDDRYAGSYAVRSLRFGTYVSVSPSGTVLVDAPEPRSMEHFHITRGERGWRVAPVGNRDRCLTFQASQPTMSTRRCTDPYSELLVWATRTPTASPLEGVPAVVPLAVVVTSVKPLESEPPARTRRLSAIRHWSTLTFLDVIVCVENVDDAHLVEAETSATAVTDCETIAVGGRSIVTYRGAFAAAERRIGEKLHVNDTLVMFANSDILFPPSQLAKTLDVARVTRRKLPRHTPNIFVTGRRRNCDPPADTEQLQGWIGARINMSEPSRCALFGDDAQDYFITNVGAFRWSSHGPLAEYPKSIAADALVHGVRFEQLVSVPPLVVGGIAFDNFILSQANKRPDTITVDATPLLSALHVDHGVDARASHSKPSSVFNSQLAHRAGGWSLGKTSIVPFSFVSSGDGKHAGLHERACVVSEGGHKCGGMEHENQNAVATYPPDAFSAPWERAD